MASNIDPKISRFPQRISTMEISGHGVFYDSFIADFLFSYTDMDTAFAVAVFHAPARNLGTGHGGAGGCK